MNILKEQVVDANFVKSLIPQKDPFVMVDKLLSFSDKEVVSGFTIKANHIFSDDNVFNAAGLIEHMAQTIALHTGYQYYLKKEQAPTGYIGSIKKAEILSLPKIGQELVTTVTILHEIMGVTLVKAEVKCNEVLIASSEIKTVLAA